MLGEMPYLVEDSMATVQEDKKEFPVLINGKISYVE